MRALRGAAILAGALTVLGAPASPAVVGPAGVDWDTYGFTIGRGGLNPYERAINPRDVHLLHQSWSFRLGSVIDAQPLFASQVLVPVRHTHVAVPRDLVIAASENGHLAAIDAITGRKVWLRHLGHVDFPSCSDLPHFGITGTPAIDRTTNSIYVADGKGRLQQLDLSTGRTKRRWTLTHDPVHEHVWSALTAWNGRVYAELAGDCDIRPYHGQVVEVRPGSGSIRRWFVTLRSDGGAIWAWGGISVDPHKNALYAATGNSFSPPNDHIGYAEHVVRLTPQLHVRASDYPGLPTGDADFGATPLLYRARGCPRQLAVGNKYGNFYVYDRDRIGSGPVQRISLGGGDRGQDALLGVAAYSPLQRLVFVSNPGRRGRYRPGILAFRVDRRCRLTLRWQATGPAGLSSSPTLAGGLVFYGTGSEDRVTALDATTGRRLWISNPRAVRGAVFNAPSVVNGMLYVGSWDGRVHAFKL